MSDLALSAPSEYLCYGSTSIINILILSVRGATQTSDSDSKEVLQGFPEVACKY